MCKNAFIGRNKTYTKCFKIRYIQMILMFFLMTISYAIRTILSVAILAMVDKSTSKNLNIPTFNWNNTGVILSSFYWSYAPLQFFSAYITQLYSPKLILIISMLFNSGRAIFIFITANITLMNYSYNFLPAFCALVPIFSIYLNYSGILICRIIQGISQGFIIPLNHNLLGKWAPTDERSWFSTTVYAGCSFGSIISMPITGYLSASWSGWPSSFYLFGILGIIWCIFYFIFGADRPATHKTISVEEKNYIEQSLGQEEEKEDLQNVKTPWKAIFTSLPYWAIIIAAIGEAWGSTFLISEITTYLSKTTGINIEESSLSSSAPYIVALIMTLFYGPLADYLIMHNLTSRKNARRIFHSIGAFFPAAALIWLSYEESRWGIEFLLITAISLNGAMFCGYNVNHIDISPRFSGVLFGISNGIGQTLAILAPVLVEFIVYDQSDKILWRILFIVAAFIYASTAVFFIVFLSAERQSWDKVSSSSITADVNNYDKKMQNPLYKSTAI